MRSPLFLTGVLQHGIRQGLLQNWKVHESQSSISVLLLLLLTSSATPAQNDGSAARSDDMLVPRKLLPKPVI